MVVSTSNRQILSLYGFCSPIAFRKPRSYIYLGKLGYQYILSLADQHHVI